MMSQIDTQTLTALLAIGQKAIEVHDAKEAEREPRAAFSQACLAHKHLTGEGFIERNSDAWDVMCDATSVEYAKVVRAERKTHNARRRLETAIRNFRRIGGVQ